MTTPQIDKMEEFRTQRYAQIERLSARKEALDAAVASGEAKLLEDGSYKILQGWDKNEIFSAQGIPQNGLDLRQNGEAAFYSTGALPWWGVGTHLEHGLHTAKAALMAAGCDFEVIKRRARFVMDEDEAGTAAPITEENPLRDGEDDQFMVIRTDTMRSLGQVGKLWTPINNAPAFAFMEEFGEPFETVGSFRGGRRVFATMKLPHTMTVDVAGINETIQMYVAAINNHDGNGGVNLMVTPYRIECGNTERLAIKGAVTKWTIKHTPGFQNALDEAQKSLRLVDRYVAAWQKDENALAQRAVTDREIASVIADVWDKDEEDGARRQNKMEARVMDIMTRFHVEQERCGKTGYALERALTGHVDHAGERRPRGDQKGMTPLALLGLSLLEDTGAPVKNKIHARAMALVGGK
jgi:phage/plasmid-like protein (TIGR03299 family)